MTEDQTTTDVDQAEPSTSGEAEGQSTLPGTPVGFPSADLPAPPPFRLLVPDGWRILPSVEAEAVLIDPEETDGVRSNVVIKATKVLAAEDPKPLLTITAKRLALHDGVVSPPEEAQPEFRDDNTCVMTLRRMVAVRSEADDEAGPLAMPTEDEDDDDDGSSEPIEVEQLTFLHYLHGPRLGFVISATGSYAPTSEAARDTVLMAIRSIVV